MIASLLHTSFLRTRTAFLTRCCSRVVFDPPVLPCVRCAHKRLPDLATKSASKHHLSKHFKHFIQALQTSTLIQIGRVFCTFDSIGQSKAFRRQASISVLHSGVVHVSSGARHSWEAADVHMHRSGAVSELDHGETWDVDDNDLKLSVDLATQALLDYLLDLADESKISAKDVCVW